MLFSTLVASENSFEIRSGAFIHSSGVFRSIYGNVKPFVGFEVGRKFSENYAGFVDLDYFSKNKKRNCCTSDIEIINGSFGLKYLYPLRSNIDGYLGSGPSFSRVNLREKSCCEKEKHSKVAVGLVLKSGITYNFFHAYYFNFFVDYLFQPVNLGRHVDIGGVKTGIGIGAWF
jgi:hypothetical protein